MRLWDGDLIELTTWRTNSVGGEAIAKSKTRRLKLGKFDCYRIHIAVYDSEMRNANTSLSGFSTSQLQNLHYLLLT